LDQVAILGQFADEWIDLAQTERSLRTAFQIAAHEAILGDAQFQRRGAGIVGSRVAILLDHLENALDATRPEFALASVDGVADSADVGSCLVRASQQLKQLRWRAPRAIRIADAVPAALGAQMLAQQLARFGIKQTHVHSVPLHMHPTPDPAWRRSVIELLKLDPSLGGSPDDALMNSGIWVDVPKVPKFEDINVIVGKTKAYAGVKILDVFPIGQWTEAYEAHRFYIRVFSFSEYLQIAKVAVRTAIENQLHIKSDAVFNQASKTRDEQ